MRADAIAAALGLPADPAERRAAANKRLGDAAPPPDSSSTDEQPVESTDIFGTYDEKPNPDEVQGVEAEGDEIEIDDDALEQATGGQMDNSTEIVYASTYVPFDSSF